MKGKIDQLDNAPLLYERVDKLENTVLVLDSLVKTLYDQQVAQERAFQALRKELDNIKGKAWSRG